MIYNIEELWKEGSKLPFGKVEARKSTLGNENYLMYFIMYFLSMKIYKIL